MGDNVYRPAAPAELRRRAEERARESAARPSHAGEVPGSPEEVRSALYELRVRQIELELQNEQLRREQTALREREARHLQLSIAVEQSPVSIVITNTAGDIEYVNPKFIDVTGYTREEAMGQNPRLLKSGDRGPEAYRELWESIAAGRTWRGEFHNRKKNGELYWESASISPIRDDSGRITHFVAVKEDITARKRVEEELQATNRSLGEATARANALAAEADRANESKSDFLANMSHEIRTPMNGVIGMTGLLLDTALNEEQRRYAEIVRSSSESLLALLNDILDFSKIEAGKLEMETLDFDLRALLDDFAATVALRAHDKGVEFVCAAAPDVPAYLRGDPGRLRQILTNLTGNAVKFTREGEIVVRADLVSETDTQAVIRFSIRDSGIGIPSDKQARLFQKFNQADASTTRQYGGTGLGLAISKQLAEMMGGQIGLVSENGQGSEFWFTTRLAKQAERATAECLPLADLRGTHVLVVDDNATNRQVLMAQLQAWGVRSEAASSSRAALQDLRRACDAGDPFRAAIVDLQMPGMDGAELARAIKADVALQSTRLVVMTALGQRGDARKMEEVGFAAYLTKPVRREEIIGCLSLVLADGPVTESAPPIVTRHAVRELRRGLVRILLADDNATNQQVAMGLLKRLGLRADAVGNGAEAIRALESLPYDLVLMDVQMPEMGGLEATRRIRDPHSAVRNHGIPIIAMTASAMESDRAECLEAGMNDYVSKPVSREALAAALDRWLPKETAAAAKPTPSVEPLPAAEPARTAEPEVPVFDQAGFMARVQDDEEFARVLVEGFLADLPRQVKALQDHLEAGGTDAGMRQAHTIKGAAANMGGEALRAVALKMEELLRSGNLGAAAALLPKLELQVARLLEALGRFLDSEGCGAPGLEEAATVNGPEIGSEG